MHHVGDRVLIKRDERQFPSRGTWPRFRGRVGTVAGVNEPDGEVLVAFGAVRRRPNGSLASSGASAWFANHETVAVSGAPGVHAPAVAPQVAGTPDDTREVA